MDRSRQNPPGEFSTATDAPETVAIAVREALVEVLGDPVPDHRLVDPEGQPWSLAIAADQLAALDG